MIVGIWLQATVSNLAGRVWQKFQFLKDTFLLKNMKNVKQRSSTKIISTLRSKPVCVCVPVNHEVPFPSQGVQHIDVQGFFVDITCSHDWKYLKRNKVPFLKLT